MSTRLVFLGVLLACLVNPALAAPITYSVTVDTSLISGTAGSLDFNFNPGPLVTQAATLQILNFSGNGSLAGSPLLFGDIGGTLPAALSFDNGAALNDYFQGFTFGSILSFNVSLFGPAVSSPDGVSTSGSTFAFSLFSDPAGTVPALTTNANGFGYVININLDGTTTATSFFLPANGVPEPGTSSLILIGFMVAVGVVWRTSKKADAGIDSNLSLVK